MLHGNISSREAFLEYGVTRLAARILELKSKGFNIITRMKQNPVTRNSYARYELANA